MHGGDKGGLGGWANQEGVLLILTAQQHISAGNDGGHFVTNLKNSTYL